MTTRRFEFRFDPLYRAAGLPFTVTPGRAWVEVGDGRLRARFGLESKPFDSSTVVIVVRVDAAVGEKTVGIVVDAVSEVYNVAADAVKPTPDLGAGADAACVSGLTSVDDKMVMLLDMNRLVASSIDLSGQSAFAD